MESMREMDYETAIEELQKSLDVWPENYTADVYLGWIYATCPQPQLQNSDRALMHARRALATHACPDKYRDWLNVIGVAVMAAAEARAGDFEAAVRTQKMAIDAIPRNEEYRDVVLRRYRSILEFYGVKGSGVFILTEW
jgi:serine/threonine-protein kinase